MGNLLVGEYIVLKAYILLLVASMGEGGGFVPFVREEIYEETEHKSYS